MKDLRRRVEQRGGVVAGEQAGERARECREGVEGVGGGGVERM